MNHLPIITDLGVTTLDLAENNISLIASRGFSGLPNLESIDLSKNRLDDDSLSHHLFSNLTRLRRLNLDDNQLTRIPLLPPSLGELTMNGNKITRLSPYSFKGLFHLLSLELEDNLFHDGNVSPLTFKPLKRVQYLCMNMNRFRSLPLGLPRSLQELRMRDNQLQEVPEGVLSELAKLRVLDLSHNLLHEGTISNRAWVKLTSLEALDLSHNSLTSVPLYLPRPLRQLTLQHNSIGRIPAYVFGHLRPGLESLRLSHNALGDEGVQGVSFVGMYRSLVELLLDNNRLGAVPRSVWQFRNLQVLRLDYNQIRSVAVGSVCHSRVAVRSALASLHLENNLIEEDIPSTTFNCIQDPSSVVTQPQEHIHEV
ncbi:extracellular matrix protein 2 [Oncorhynchus masou masou]|uniref:extracellular matrix protein 2 n=1 Tax=Oncorhynchus masou masou TaxID=90313 RepID=UPI003183B623